MFTWLHNQQLALWDRYWPFLLGFIIGVLAYAIWRQARQNAADEAQLLELLKQECPRVGEWYGVPLHEATGWSFGRLYETLERLEKKGLVSTWRGDPTPQRRMRPKRFVRLAP